MERMTELQQSKYQDLQAGLPSELSMQLAEVALALGSAEDQVTPPSLICVRLHSLSMGSSSDGYVIFFLVICFRSRQGKERCSKPKT